MKGSEFFNENYRKALDLKIASHHLDNEIEKWVEDSSQEIFPILGLSWKGKALAGKSKSSASTYSLDFYTKWECSHPDIEAVSIGIMFQERFTKDGCFGFFPYVTLCLKDKDRAKTYEERFIKRASKDLVGDGRYPIESAVDRDSKQLCICHADADEGELSRKNDLESVVKDLRFIGAIVARTIKL